VGDKRRRRMNMRITINHIIERQTEKMISIEGIEGAMAQESLPREYLMEYPHFYADSKWRIFIWESANNRHSLSVGDKLFLEKFDQIFLIMRRSGDRLHEIKERERGANRDWLKAGKEFLEV
jgi:hypothetical protein